MKKEELLRFCRYYHGEDEPPKKINHQEQAFWYTERHWVSMMASEASFGDLLSRYIDAGLTHFNEKDDTPVTLKALLFNRFEQWNESDGFEDWYLNGYLKN